MVIFFASYVFPHPSSSKFLAKLQKLTDQAKGQKFAHIAVVSEAVHCVLKLSVSVWEKQYPIHDCIICHPLISLSVYLLNS